MRRSGSPGRQLALLWGGAAASLVALAPLAPRLAAGLPGCPFKTLTGVPCPLCGTTRAALALARLEPLAALAAFPLPTVAWIAFVGGGLAAGLAALAGRGVPTLPSPLPRALALGAAAAVLANWIYLIATGA